jgi:protein-S-isoprenylcysteine O-methyltransferase Ste14
VHSPALNILGLTLAAAGVALAIWARFYLGRNWGMPLSIKENPELVTTGPYAYIRNPIYTGILLALLGSSLIIWWWFVIFAWSAVYFVYASRGEEKIMLREFPDTYPAYKARTKMLVPFIL